MEIFGEHMCLGYNLVIENTIKIENICMDNIREDKKQLKRAIEKLLRNFEDIHNNDYAITAIHINRIMEFNGQTRINGVDVDLEVQ